MRLVMLRSYVAVGVCTLSSLLYAETLYGFGVEEERGVSTQQHMAQPMQTIDDLRMRVIEQQERIEGLTTIIEGLSASLNELQAQKMQDNKPSGGSSEELLQKLAAMIDEINANYVRKDELKALLKGVSKGTTASTQQKQTAKRDTLEGKSHAKIYSEGVRHFTKQRYDEAKKRFLITDKKGYKPAASNYYLGEIAYYTKQYEDAIFYFKKSAGLYDKASYIDVLLLHTAISLHKTGQKSQAKIFYENIIANYPDKKTAKIAKERLKKL